MEHSEDELLRESQPQSLMQVMLVHDVLKNIMTGRLTTTLSEEERRRCFHYQHVLCWVLGHTEPDEIGAEFCEFIRPLLDRVLAEGVQQMVDEQIARHRKN